MPPAALAPASPPPGGFPASGPARPGAGFGPFVAPLRRLPALAVAAAPGAAVWAAAA
ncbi:PaaI family thioesterase, partial [Mycobacterium tuberculosis]